VAPLLRRFRSHESGVIGIRILRRDRLLGAEAPDTLRGCLDVFSVRFLEVLNDLAMLLAVKGTEERIGQLQMLDQRPQEGVIQCFLCLGAAEHLTFQLIEQFRETGPSKRAVEPLYLRKLRQRRNVGKQRIKRFAGRLFAVTERREPKPGGERIQSRLHGSERLRQGIQLSWLAWGSCSAQ
jgi:hypothetical protein